MTNSFSDLPGAVELADHFIRSIEITSGIYINQTVMALFLFILLSIFNYSFPLMPLNITIINYFTVGFAGILIAYWALRPSNKVPKTGDKPFLKRVMPLVFACAAVEAVGLTLIFLLSPDYLKTASSDTLVLFSFMIFGFLFLLFATKVYCGFLTKKEKFQLFILGIFQPILLYLMLQVSFLVRFFSITKPYPAPIFFSEAFLIVLVCGLVQYFIVKRFFFKK
jgi:magnesium-transporting ATPase (P-type)